ncbi:flagellar hook-length control protein FliK [Magnetospira sp. QH-2]|uniref:flagellar hook-length control protein FliK n=1 Tax=Magnetospira sp. (strain QH-2) TaxID=1288970 RepID=UPI0003E80DA5|nr:flagellar hook-length control protein FliK [Magnetospira sp. QH-2]CCQ73054.1 putative Flagellar hook-length control protein FliK [Magnetospira sp. QH-2]
MPVTSLDNKPVDPVLQGTAAAARNAGQAGASATAQAFSMLVADVTSTLGTSSTSLSSHKDILTTDRPRPSDHEPRDDSDRQEAAPVERDRPSAADGDRRDDRDDGDRVEARDRSGDHRDDDSRAARDDGDEAPRQTDDRDDGGNEQRADRDTDQDQNPDDGTANQNAESQSDDANTGQQAAADGDDNGQQGQNLAPDAQQAALASHEAMNGAVTDLAAAARNGQQNAQAQTTQKAGVEQVQVADATPDSALRQGRGQQQANTQAQANTGESQQNTAKTASNAQTQAQQNNGQSNLQNQQAADLSRRVDPGRQVQVNVSVTQDSEAGSGQPRLSGATLAALSDEGRASGNPVASSGQNSQSGTGNSQNNANQAMMQANAQAASQTQTNAQAQNAQGNQGQAMNNAVSEARGAATTTQQAATTQQTTTTAGGESNNTQTVATQQTQQTQQTAQAKAAAQTARPAPQTPVAEQVSVQISKAVAEGMDKISIRLNPADLGRVDVRLEMSDGRVQVTVIADRPETLDMLRNDSRSLEKALQDAGLDTDSGSMNFSLRDEQQQAEEGGRKDANDLPVDDETLLDDPELEEVMAALTDPDSSPAARLAAQGKLDIRA